MCVVGRGGRAGGGRNIRTREVGAAGRGGAGEETRMKAADGRW